MTRWLSFDLDGTLHDYRGASSQAVQALLRAVRDSCGTETSVLAGYYDEILRADAERAFVEPLSSAQFRMRRFSELLAAAGVDAAHGQLESLLSLYDSVLADHIRPAPGAAEIMGWARANGLHLAVLTEGPEDAQQLTLERLGLWHFVDLLITSTAVGVSKTGGALFEIALERMVPCDEPVLHVGDSLERDVLPALVAGFQPVLVGQPWAHVSPEVRNQAFLVHDLMEAKTLLARELRLPA